MTVLGMIAPVRSGQRSDANFCPTPRSANSSPPSQLLLSSSTALKSHVFKRLSSNVRTPNRSRDVRLQPRAAAVPVPGRGAARAYPAPTDKAGLPIRKRPSAATERKETEAEAAAVQRAGAVSVYSAENLKQMYSKQPFRVRGSFPTRPPRSCSHRDTS